MTAPAEDPRSGECEVVIDDQCPITFRRCDRPCGTECIRGMFAAAGSGDTDSSGEACDCRLAEQGLHRLGCPNRRHDNVQLRSAAARPAVDRAEPPEGLREQIADAVVFEWREWDVTRAEAEALTDAILALPELRRALGGTS